jgi:hypothetical protein
MRSSQASPPGHTERTTMAMRNVISTLNTADGTEIMESNHFCVLKSRGAILSVYETV